RFGQANEFPIDRGFITEIALVQFEFNLRNFLDAAEHFETAPAPRAPDRVVGIGDVLQFIQNETGHDDCPFEKSVLDQFGDTAIDDCACVEEQEIGRRVLSSETNVRNNERE